MTDFTDLVAATKAVVDPATSGADLAKIAQAQPRLWPLIAAHPNAYHGLLQWLDAKGDDATKQAVAARQADVPTSAEEVPVSDPATTATEEAPASEPIVVSDVEPEAAKDVDTDVQPEQAPPPTIVEQPEVEPDVLAPPVTTPAAVKPLSTPKPVADPWFKTPNGRKALFGIGGGVVAVVIVIILVVTLIVVPNNRAADAAAESAASASASAAAQAQAEQDHQDAIAAFGTASHLCTDANTALTSAIASAQQNTKTNPSTMKDPTLIDKLKDAISTAKAVTPCTVPTMAADTAAIKQQTTQLGTDTQTVKTATLLLDYAATAVTASVQAKKDATASPSATKPSSPAPPTVANLNLKTYFTWNSTDNNGYKQHRTVSLTNFIKASDTSSLNSAWNNAGGQGDFPMTDGQYSFSGTGLFNVDSATGAFAIGKVTVSNLTPQYPAEQFGGGYTDITLLALDTIGNSVEVNMNTSFICMYYSNGTQCWRGGNSFNFDSGKISCLFIIYLSDVFTPNHPHGKPAHAGTVLFGAGDGDKAMVNRKKIPVNW